MNDIEAMLLLVNPSHSILMDENIGLIGEFNNKIDDTTKETDTLFKIGTNAICNKRGDKYRVIDANGFMFDYYVKYSGFLIKDNNNIGYIFILNDIKAESNFDKFFEEYPTSDGVIISYNNKLISNNIKTEYTSDNIIYESDIDIEYINNREYILKFNGDTYISSIIDFNNNIGKFRTTL